MNDCQVCGEPLSINLYGSRRFTGGVCKRCQAGDEEEAELREEEREEEQEAKNAEV